MRCIINCKPPFTKKPKNKITTDRAFVFVISKFFYIPDLVVCKSMMMMMTKISGFIIKKGW